MTKCSILCKEMLNAEYWGVSLNGGDAEKLASRGQPKVGHHKRSSTLNNTRFVEITNDHIAGKTLRDALLDTKFTANGKKVPGLLAEHFVSRNIGSSRKDYSTPPSPLREEASREDFEKRENELVISSNQASSVFEKTIGRNDLTTRSTFDLWSLLTPVQLEQFLQQIAPKDQEENPASNSIKIEEEKASAQNPRIESDREKQLRELKEFAEKFQIKKF